LREYRCDPVSDFEQRHLITYGFDHTSSIYSSAHLDFPTSEYHVPETGTTFSGTA